MLYCIRQHTLARVRIEWFVRLLFSIYIFHSTVCKLINEDTTTTCTSDVRKTYARFVSDSVQTEMFHLISGNDSNHSSGALDCVHCQKITPDSMREHQIISDALSSVR